MKKYILLFLIAAFSFNGHLYSQGIRVSVKIILDPADGSRPSLDTKPPWPTDQYIKDHIARGNVILAKYNRGLRLILTEIDSIGGIDSDISNKYYRFSRKRLSTLEKAAKKSPDDFKWRSKAINIYITNDLIIPGEPTKSDGGGKATYPEDGEAIIMTDVRDPEKTHFLHEIGHFFDLKHTHRKKNKCPNTVDETKKDVDEVDDTLIDWNCARLSTINSISDYHFGDNYKDLPKSEREQIDDLFNNVMGYRYDKDKKTGRTVLTEGQLDKFVQSMFTYEDREDVISALPIYIKKYKAELKVLFPTIGFSSPAFECNGISSGFGKLTNKRKLIVLRKGKYPLTKERTPLIFDKPCIIVGGGKGSAIISY